MAQKAFMSIKFYEGDTTKQIISEITEALKEAGIENFVMVRDVEEWGKIHLPSDALMPDYAFPKMRASDMLIIEFSEKGVGLGIGAGYAFAQKVPIYIIAKEGSDISSTIEGLARAVIFYKEPKDITEGFKKIFERQKLPIILTSKSKVRKAMLQEAGIPFEVCSFEVDETPDESLSMEEQFADISRRKAIQGMKETAGRGDRILVSADQNLVFKGIAYGKPQDINQARRIIQSFMGNVIEAYVGNTVLVIKDEQIVEEICKTDVAKMYVEPISNQKLESYLKAYDVCSVCGGISIRIAPFMKLVEGRRSTAEGMTIQFLRKLSYQ